MLCYGSICAYIIASDFEHFPHNFWPLVLSLPRSDSFVHYKVTLDNLPTLSSTKIPEIYEEGWDMNVPFKADTLCSFFSQFIHQLGISVLITIYCKEKLLWWGWRDALVNGCKEKSLSVTWTLHLVSRVIGFSCKAERLLVTSRKLFSSYDRTDAHAHSQQLTACTRSAQVKKYPHAERGRWT